MSPIDIFEGLINTMTWSNMFCGDKGKKGGMVGKGKGPWYRNAVIIRIYWFFLEGLYIQLFPLGNAHNAHFSSSIWCNESWEASLPSLCLDHIIAHEIYQFFHALSLKLAPTCFIKQCGTSRTQGSEYTWWSRLQIIINVQHKVHVTCKLYAICAN